MPDHAADDVLADSFAAHDAFESVEDGFALTTTPLETVVTLGADRLVVTVWAPTLGATAADDVPDVVSEGFADTFERRIADPAGALRADAVDVTVERDGDRLVVEGRFAPPADRAAAEAKALIDFVEGTWVGGLVPGYDYEPPAADLLARAADHGQIE
jgi:hypothetical protein